MPRKVSERSLWKQYTRDHANITLRNQIVEWKMELVRKIHAQVCANLARCEDRDDILSAGMAALIVEVERYDPARGVAFAGSAYKRIRGAMVDVIRSSLHSRGVSRRSNQQRLSQECRERVDRVIGRREGSPTVAQYGVDPDEHGLAYRPLRTRTVRDSRQAIDYITRGLDTEEKTIVYLKYISGLSLREIATLMDVNENRVWQIHKESLERLRKLHAGEKNELL